MIRQETAVRVGNKVSLTYRGLWLSFDWYADSLFIAVDNNGDVWAYTEEPTTTDELELVTGVEQILDVWDSASNFEGYDECIHYYNMAIVDWKHSLVEFTIKK